MSCHVMSRHGVVSVLLCGVSYRMVWYRILFDVAGRPGYVLYCTYNASRPWSCHAKLSQAIDTDRSLPSLHPTCWLFCLFGSWLLLADPPLLCASHDTWRRLWAWLGPPTLTSTWPLLPCSTAPTSWWCRFKTP